MQYSARHCERSKNKDRKDDPQKHNGQRAASSPVVPDGLGVVLSVVEDVCPVEEEIGVSTAPVRFLKGRVAADGQTRVRVEGREAIVSQSMFRRMPRQELHQLSSACPAAFLRTIRPVAESIWLRKLTALPRGEG